jgi:hypothetical protein
LPRLFQRRDSWSERDCARSSRPVFLIRATQARLGARCQRRMAIFDRGFLLIGIPRSHRSDALDSVVCAVLGVSVRDCASVPQLPWSAVINNAPPSARSRFDYFAHAFRQSSRPPLIPAFDHARCGQPCQDSQIHDSPSHTWEGDLRPPLRVHFHSGSSRA